MELVGGGNGVCNGLNPSFQSRFEELYGSKLFCLMGWGWGGESWVNLSRVESRVEIFGFLGGVGGMLLNG